MTLCLIGVFVSFVGISNELWTPDEPRDAAIGEGHVGVGLLGNTSAERGAFLEKPPFYWWAQSSVFAAFGRATPTLARLPSAVFGFAALLLYLRARTMFFPQSHALIGGLILLSTALFSLTTHWIVVDNALLFAVTGAWTLFAYAESRDGTTRQFLLLGMYVFLAFAFLTKGVVGLGIPALGMGVYLCGLGGCDSFLAGTSWWEVVSLGGAAALWLWLLWQEGGRTAVETFIVYNQVQRFFPHGGVYTGGHVRPIWYYFLNTPVDLLPWTPFVLLAALSAWRNWKRLPDLHRDGVRFCIAGTLPVFWRFLWREPKRHVLAADFSIVRSVRCFLGHLSGATPGLGEQTGTRLGNLSHRLRGCSTSRNIFGPEPLAPLASFCCGSVYVLLCREISTAGGA